MESAGEYGKSALRLYTFPSVVPDKEYLMESSYFSEGITVLNEIIYQLTWLERKMFTYSLNFELLESTPLPTEVREGWGICNDGEFLYISDGSSYIYKMDPITKNILGSVRVTDENNYISSINELEWVNGEIWANIYFSKYIVRVDPVNGAVLGWIDLTGLEQSETLKWRSGFVLNGIAVHNSRIFITGKRWSYMYEIELKFDHNVLQTPKLK